MMCAVIFISFMVKNDSLRKTIYVIEEASCNELKSIVYNLQIKITDCHIDSLFSNQITMK
jgi:hypothetical protein